MSNIEGGDGMGEAASGRAASGETTRRLHGLTVLAVEAPEAARHLRAAAARVLEFREDDLPPLAAPMLDVLVVVGSHLFGHMGIPDPGNREKLLALVRAETHKAMIAAGRLRTDLHRISLGERSSALHTQLEPMGPRRLVEAIAEDGGDWVLSVTRDDITLSFELTAGGVAAAQGWAPGRGGSQRLVGVQALAKLLTLRGADVCVMPMQRQREPIMTVAAALDRVLEIELGVDDAGELVTEPTGTPTVQAPAAAVMELVAALEEEEPNDPSERPTARAPSGTRTIAAKRPPTMPISLRRRKRKTG